MVAYGVRGEVIEVLRGMVQEGTITAFRILHFGKADTGEDPTVIVSAPGGPDAAAMQALRRRISDALVPLLGEVVVIVEQDRLGKPL